MKLLEITPERWLYCIMYQKIEEALKQQIDERRRLNGI